MNKPIAIIAGEPNSIASEIIFKSWILRRKYICKPWFIIVNYQHLNVQRKKLNYQIDLKKINKESEINKTSKNKLLVYDIEYKQKRPFEKISDKLTKLSVEQSLKLVKLNLFEKFCRTLSVSVT